MSVPRPKPRAVAELLRDGRKCNRSGVLWKEFLEFHFENPWIYKRLKEICMQLREQGFTRYSTRTIISVLRFESDIRTGGQEVQIDGEARRVKLNDHHSPYYARMLIEELPDFWDFFELRNAEGDPVPVPTGFLARLRQGGVFSRRAR